MTFFMSRHYENLTRLYLRLKGFVVTNLIVHSEEQGAILTELDIIGFRMPFHTQDDRQVVIKDELECSSKMIEVIIADVKGTGNLKSVKFNNGLRKNEEAIHKIIGWLGCYENIVPELVKKFRDCFNLHKWNELNGFAHFSEKLNVGLFNFKFTFFCPNIEPWNGKGFKYIAGDEMMNFIWECLNTNNKIETCSRIYDFTGWNELESIIRFFKDADTKLDLEDFNNEFLKTA
ncbi:MAG: hypothetical protein V2I33_17060 [Kangiellaceae bacterium]|jgi:hypothetical protein|nr:hypothetical protein [Kangiellaceae bacterium]